MKKLLFILLFLGCSSTLNAQAPDLFKYQATIRDLSGFVVSNQLVGVRISILENSSSGSVVYSETHGPTTNDIGNVSLSIGAGNPQSGDFSTINWGGAIHFLKVEVDPTGGTSYSVVGAAQLLSVPYALYANEVDSIDWTGIQNVPADLLDGDDDSDILAGLSCSTNEVAMWDGSNWVCSAIGNSTAGQNATDAYGTGQLTLTVSTTTYTLIPGLTQTINVPPNSKVFVHTYGGLQTVGTGTAYGIADIALYVDGTLVGAGGQQRLIAANTTGVGNMIDSWSIAKSYQLSAGSHTITVMAKDGGGTADVNVSSGSAPLIQGVLSVVIINQ